MLTIYLHTSQQGLLEQIRHICPGLEAARQSVYPGYKTYHAYLAERKEEVLRQKGWLVAHQVLFLDTEEMRERRARAFMQRAALSPEQSCALSVSFKRVGNDPACHSLCVRSGEREATLYLLPGWSGRQRVPFHLWVGAIYVARQPDALTVHCFKTNGCLGHEIWRQRTDEEMTRWLLEKRYVQIYCFSCQPDVCGLYCRIHDDGVPEMLRVDE